jgi:hypothetical protein
MKKLLTISCCCLSLYTLAQDAIYNNGSVLQINGNARLQVNGHFVNNAGSNYINEGLVNILGNFTNSQYMTAPFNGTVYFDGNTLQTVTGATALFAKNIVFNNAAGVTVLDTLKVAGEVSFIKGIVTAANNANPVLFTSIASISNTNLPTDASHVNGYVVRQGLGSFTFPVGDGNKYQKLLLNAYSNSNGLLVKYNASNAGTAAFTNGGTETDALVSYNTNEYWNVDPWNGGTASGTVSIFWDGYKDVFTNPLLQRKVAHQLNTAWLNEGTTATGSIAAGEVTSNVLSSWGRFALGSITTPLPLYVISFSGVRTNNVNQLQWMLGNTSYLQQVSLEKSTNGINFNSISSTITSTNDLYKFADNQQQAGNSYYRLKLVNSYGKIGYSNIVVLSNNAALLSSIYPNPAKSSTTLRIGDSKLLNTKAILMDAGGRTISTILIRNYFEIIQLENLASGNYLLQLKNKEVLKIIKK